VEPKNRRVSIFRQCELLGISRAGYYYRPRPVSDENLLIMRLLDEEYTRHPFYGARRLSDWVRRQGHPAGREKVGRLIKEMGLEAIYPKKPLSLKNKEHKTYPYLLRTLEIDRCDRVWCSDITYVRMRHGFAYLTVVMDWFSRYVLSWELSLSLESDFCLLTLERALERAKPGIFNSDQGCQYTSEAFTSVLKAAQVLISMDGKGRAFDNIMVERLWRTVKYEEVYLNEYSDHFSARERLGEYFKFYNEERRHSGLGKRTPSEVYHGSRNTLIASA
jgi:putative transposase